MTSSVASGDLALSHKLLGLQAGLRFRRFAIRFRKYSPDQPRIPGGNPDGGRFTFGRGDAEPDKDARVRVAQYRARGGRGQWPDATPAQQARLAASEAQAATALARVRDIDGHWRPEPTLQQGVEGAIRANEHVARQAADRYDALQRAKATPGPFARESIPVPLDGKRPSAAGQRLLDSFGRQDGCHTCGTRDPGTKDGNFVGDHQHPRALAGAGAQRLIPAVHNLQSFSRRVDYAAKKGKIIMIHAIDVSPSNSLVFVCDLTGGDPAQSHKPDPIMWTSNCVSVGTLMEYSGTTHIELAHVSEFDVQEAPVFDGVIETPTGSVAVMVVDGSILLQALSGSEKTRITVWADHHSEPENISIGFECAPDDAKVGRHL